MKLKHQLLLAGLSAACAAAGAVLYRVLRKKEPMDIVDEAADLPEASAEEIFSREWASVLTTDSQVFNGLYTSLLRIAAGEARKPEKTLREWCQRTHYKWEDSPADQLCRQYILPLMEEEDREGLVKWAERLLSAASAAGITNEPAQTLTLTECNVRDYAEWDGQELYPEDEIAVLAPAWYQNGNLLEQGTCRKADTAEE